MQKQTHTAHIQLILLPPSNAERIVPGLEDIKSLDYPIKSYFTPSPTHAKSVEQTITPRCEGWGCEPVKYCVEHEVIHEEMQLGFPFLLFLKHCIAILHKNKMLMQAHENVV